MSSQTSIRDSFFEECADLLDALLDGLALIEEGDCTLETVNAVFRAVHSIKGGAGAFKLSDLVSFAHTFETVLDAIRSQRLEVDPNVVRVLLRAADQLANLVEAARDDGEVNVTARDSVLADLELYLDPDDTGNEEFEFAPMALDFDSMLGSLSPPNRSIKICFQPFSRLLANGHEPAYLISHLSKAGQLEVTLDIDAIPPLSECPCDGASLIWKMRFSAPDPEAAVAEIFEFVEGLCVLEISQCDSPSAALPLVLDLAQNNETPTDIDSSDLPLPHLPPAMADPKKLPGPSDEPSTPAGPVSQRTSDSEPKGAKPTLRVDLDRVDRLINTVGELIINQAVISQRISKLGLARGADVMADLEDYKLLARELHEGVMGIRAQPVKSLFQRMSRIAREATEATGKNARFVTKGEGTEVDKTVVERLADPLTHMIRNAVDHGLESPEKRLAAGKPEVGEIRLSASHRSGNVHIELSDDGAGLNRPKILEIAISKGLIPPNSDLPDAEIDKLLFLPGFSTATVVSNLSGRGVGMDVVKNAVQSLGGRVSISSIPGQGTTFSIILPLTLAVMDGMIVSVAGETMVIPIAAVLENIRPAAKDIHAFGPEGRLLSIRERYVPIVDVAETLGLPGAASDQAEILIIVESEAAGRCALKVEAIHDQRQVVIKSVSGNYGMIPGVSAATILGDGRIALILDTDFLAQSENWKRPTVPNGIDDRTLEMET